MIGRDRVGGGGLGDNRTVGPVPRGCREGGHQTLGLPVLMTGRSPLWDPGATAMA